MTPEIAIIDSGVNPMHPHVQGVSGGHGYVLDARGEIKKTDDFMDEIGHGTAISGIIRQSVPLAGLYAVKIFKRELGAPASFLIEALAWAMENKFRIIHLSLGVENEIFVHELDRLCQMACDKNIIILASAKGPQDRTYPAFFQTVIGVYWNHDCNWGQMVFHPDSKIEFGAHGWPRPIPGLPQEQNFRGHSFAVAHVTARVSTLVQKYPQKDLWWIKKQLARESRTIIV